MRFQALSTDVLHWLGPKRIERWISMSNLKADAVLDAGIEIIRQVPIPDDCIPAHTDVEITAKRAAGYFVGAIWPGMDSREDFLAAELANVRDESAPESRCLHSMRGRPISRNYRSRSRRFRPTPRTSDSGRWAKGGGDGSAVYACPLW